MIDVNEKVKALPLSKNTRMSVDAGGSTLRLVECDLEGNTLNHERYVQPRDLFKSMDEGIAKFLLDIGRRPVAGVVGAAGPIDHGRSVKLTNLQEWPAFDVDNARDNFGIQFHLFNDLVDCGCVIAGIEARRPRRHPRWTPEADGPRLVVTLSTGLNDALALPDRFGGLRFVAGESGHIPFAPRNAEELQYLEYIWSTGHKYVSFEDAMSGKHGFRLSYQFVTQALGIKPLDATAEAFAKAGAMVGPVVSRGPCKIKTQPAFEPWKSWVALWALTSRPALQRLSARAAFILVGSISANKPEMDFFLDKSPFLDRFKEMGPMTNVVNAIPISRVLHPEFGILGATEIARHLPSPA